MTKLLLSAAVLTLLSMNVAEAHKGAAGSVGKVHTHVGTIPVKKTAVINNWHESQVKGYLGKGKVVTGLKADGEPVVGGICKNPYTCE